ncbi:polysaccharide biosynthesis tyrosine autokinase [Leifsonia aquatica]|uniref:polysaccharide biosynthesis tyrosine autokinase n=1 Tax=Leifsonia aquatica TaxID=144185 RepID=UPI0037F898B5
MDGRRLFRLLLTRWMIIVAVVELGALAGAAFTLLATPKYTAESELLVSALGGESTTDLAQGNSYSQSQARNFSLIATRNSVLDPVISTLGLHTTTGALSQQISVSVPLNTSLISVSVEDTSPSRAAAIANAVGASLSNVVSNVTPRRSDGTLPVSLQTVQQATVPRAQSSPNASVSILLGALLGFVVAVAVLVGRELVGAKVRSTDQLRQLGDLTILGSVAQDRSITGNFVALGSSAYSRRAEEFRQLRTSLRFLQTGKDRKVFVVTSSVPGEGKSVTAANLAAVLAASGSSVCLVEADLRRPSLGSYLDLEDSVGLTSVLAGDVGVDDALQTWGSDGLRVLLAGQIPPNPSELLSSLAAEELFVVLSDRFDTVIVDCPPLLPVTDAAIIARYFDGAIMVVGCGTVQVREFRRSLEMLDAAGVPLLGVIANRTPADAESKYQRAYTSTERSTTPESAPAPTGEPESRLRREPSDADARR